MTETKEPKYTPGWVWFILSVILIALTGATTWVVMKEVREVEEVVVPAVKQMLVAPIPDRPKSPELDFAAECVWLTNHVLGPVKMVKKPKAREAALKECNKEYNESYCAARIESQFGQASSKARSSFFYKCLEEIRHSIEASCCYDAWDCRQGLHYCENELEETEEQCYDYCVKLPGDRPCYSNCN
jgi:hypothetical protein